MNKITLANGRSGGIRRGLTMLLAALGLCCVAAPLDIGVAHADGRFNVGYRVLDFQLPQGQTLTVAVWYPTQAPPQRYVYGGPTQGKLALDAAPDREHGPYPLLVYSHGYGGSGLAAVYFTEPLAARGWIVVAPDHHDRYSAVRIRGGHKRAFDRAGFMRYVKRITSSGPQDRAPYTYRWDEMQVALDEILATPLFGKLIDRERIAVGGHSFGGFTALGLCGTINSRHDQRIKALLLFSTGAGGYLFREAELARVRLPAMYFYGEREKRQQRGEHTMAQMVDRVYRNLAPPKYLLEVKGGTHFSFNNRFNRKLFSRLLSGSPREFALIRRYGIAFLEKYVAGRDDGGVLRQADPMLSHYESQIK